jgi:hypothetical protein
MTTSYNIFHESVPVSERTTLMRSDLYRPTLRICTTSKIVVSHVEPTLDNRGLIVTLMLNTGFPVLILTHADGHFYAATTDSCNTMSSTTVCDTINPMYMVKALYKSVKGAEDFASVMNYANTIVEQMMVDLGRHTFNAIVGERKISMQYPPFLDNATLGALVEVFFGERNAIDLPIEQRQVLESIRAERNQRVANLRDVTDRMVEMLNPNKLMVTYLPKHGYTVQQLSMPRDFHEPFVNSKAVARDSIKQVTPITFCRKLEDLPADMYDQVLGSLTLAKMHLLSRYPELAQTISPEPHDKLIHSIRPIVSQELSAVVESHHDRRSIVMSV